MKAIVIREYGGIDKLVYEEVETPKPGLGKVLVRVRATGVNHLEHDIREGISGFKAELPHVPGPEGVGEIAELGPGVTGVEVGARVAINNYQSCGNCRTCLAGEDNICLNGVLIGAETWGCYAEYALCRANNAIPLPDGLSFEKAAASIVCGGTTWHMAVSLGRVEAGEDVLVNAAGSGVGSFGIQIAKLHGANVIASAGSDEKLQKARELGADHVINYRTQTLSEEVMRATNGKGADLVIESVGGDVLKESIHALCRSGRLITCGAHAGEHIDLNVIELFRKHITLRGGHCATKRETARVLQLIADGKIEPVIHSVFPLENAREAAQLTANRDFFGKMVLLP